MGTIGLFTREQLKSGPASKQKIDSGLSVERLRELGLKGVKRMNPDADCPNMAPAGSKRPEIYLLGEAPSQRDDRNGEPFSDEIGDTLINLIPEEVKIRYGYIVRTLPPLRANKQKQTREPSEHEIECFRRTVEEDIEETRPKVIVAVGVKALNWCVGESAGQISTCRGRFFPAQIGKHKCWVFAVEHPSFFIRLERSGDYSQIPAAEFRRYFELDIKTLLRALPLLDEPKVEPLERVSEGIRSEKKDLRAIERFLDDLGEEAVTIDVETNRKRPYSDGAKLLTIAIGTHKKILAIPIDHPGATWTPGEKKKLIGIISDFLRKKNPKICHNTPFDLEWMLWKFGPGVLWGGIWHDTMGQAYILDERKGGMSLNFLNIQHFGLRLKRQSGGRMVKDWAGLFMEEVSDLDRSRLEQTHIDDVLLYNGRDVKYTHKLYLRQKKLLKDEGLYRAYRGWVLRAVSMVVAMFKGIPVDQGVNARFQKELTEKIAAVRKKIKDCQIVRTFERQYGEFNPESPQQLVTVFRDLLKRREGARGNKYTTDEEALSRMTDEPLAALILELRGYNKLKGTYVDRMGIKHPESLVYPDGRIHCAFKHTATDTGRLASEDPNNQNWPKRTDAWIREQIKPPEKSGKIILATDYGQIEARVIGMASRDKYLCKSLWEDFDIHMVWAEKIVQVYPKAAKARHGKLDAKGMNDFRGEVKNQMVFPAFFGSRMESIARDLEMPENKFAPLFEEFWDMFPDVLRWQEDLMKFYRTYHYVETLTGRRRRGPMNKNQIINAPIQGTASDIVVNAWNRITRIAHETDRPWLAPNLNIHDDLTSFDIPKSKRDEAIEVYVREMCAVPFDWINVPISVEVSEGINWAEMKKVGKFSSDKLDSQLNTFFRKVA